MEGDVSVDNNQVVPDKAIQIVKTITSQISMLFGLAAVLALSVAVIMWAMRPEYSSFMDNMSDADVSAISSVLAANEIPYKIDMVTGNLLVANDRKHEARLLVSSEGLPSSSPLGFELLKNDSSLGTSQFLETARYQHALETELSRSVSSMRNVESARVHLALPKRTAFLRKKDKSSASVMVKVSAGRELDKGQITSIVHLVASSVPYLETKNVTVVDQWGHLLSSSSNDAGFERSQKQFAHKKEIEQLYVDRIESMLAPIFGYGRVKVQVNAEMDFTRIESTQELFDSDVDKIRSEQVIDQQQVGALAPIGIPGALTNQPPAGGTVEPQTEGGEETTPQVPTNSNRNSVRNYELDKTIRHVQQPAGEVQRITVAVVADDWVATGSNGSETRTPLSEEDIGLITGLVREAIGYNEERGDRIAVYNKTFQTVEIEAVPEAPLWKQDWFVSIIKQTLAGIAILLIIFTVVKPAMKTLQGRHVAAKPGNEANQLTALTDGGIASESPRALASDYPNYVEQLAMAKQLVSQDPKQVAKVVKTWVSNNG